MPQTIPRDEAVIYQQLRAHHCHMQLNHHDCAGRIIIDRHGITLACPLCGNGRAINPPGLNINDTPSGRTSE